MSLRRSLRHQNLVTIDLSGGVQTRRSCSNKEFKNQCEVSGKSTESESISTITDGLLNLSSPQKLNKSISPQRRVRKENDSKPTNCTNVHTLNDENKRISRRLRENDNLKKISYAEFDSEGSTSDEVEVSKLAPKDLRYQLSKKLDESASGNDSFEEISTFHTTNEMDFEVELDHEVEVSEILNETSKEHYSECGAEINQLNSENLEDNTLKISNVEMISQETFKSSDQNFTQAIVVGGKYLKTFEKTWPAHQMTPEFHFLYYFELAYATVYNKIAHYGEHERVLVVVVVGLESVILFKKFKYDHCDVYHPKFDMPYFPKKTNSFIIEKLKKYMELKLHLEEHKNIKVVFSYLPDFNVDEHMRNVTDFSRWNYDNCSCYKLLDEPKYQNWSFEFKQMQASFNQVLFSLKLNEYKFGHYFEYNAGEMKSVNGKWNFCNDISVAVNDLAHKMHVIFNGGVENGNIGEESKILIIGDTWLNAILVNWSVFSDFKPLFYFSENITFVQISEFMSLFSEKHKNVLYIIGIPISSYLEDKICSDCVDHIPLNFPVVKNDVLNSETISSTVEFMLTKMKWIDQNFENEATNSRTLYLTNYVVTLESYQQYVIENHVKHDLDLFLQTVNNDDADMLVNAFLNHLNFEIVKYNKQKGLEPCLISGFIKQSDDAFMYPKFIKDISPPNDNIPKMINCFLKSIAHVNDMLDQRLKQPPFPSYNVMTFATVEETSPSAEHMHEEEIGPIKTHISNGNEREAPFNCVVNQFGNNEVRGIPNASGNFSNVTIVAKSYLKFLISLWPDDNKIKPNFLLLDSLKFEECINLCEQPIIKDSQNNLIVVILDIENLLDYSVQFKASHCPSNHENLLLPKSFENYPTKNVEKIFRYLKETKFRIQKETGNFVVFSYLPEIGFEKLVNEIISECCKENENCKCDQEVVGEYVSLSKIESFSRKFNTSFNETILENRLNEITPTTYFEFYPFPLIFVNRNWCVDSLCNIDDTMRISIMDDKFIMSKIDNMSSALEKILFTPFSDALSIDLKLDDELTSAEEKTTVASACVEHDDQEVSKKHARKTPSIKRNNISTRSDYEIILIGDLWLESVMNSWPETARPVKFYCARYLTLKTIESYLTIENPSTGDSRKNTLLLICIPLAEIVKYRSHKDCVEHSPCYYPICNYDSDSTPDQLETQAQLIFDRISAFENVISEKVQNFKISYTTFYPIDFKLIYSSVTQRHEMFTGHEIDATHMFDENIQRCVDYVGVCLNSFITKLQIQRKLGLCDIFTFVSGFSDEEYIPPGLKTTSNSQTADMVNFILKYINELPIDFNSIGFNVARNKISMADINKEATLLYKKSNEKSELSSVAVEIDARVNDVPKVSSHNKRVNKSSKLVPIWKDKPNVDIDRINRNVDNKPHNRNLVAASEITKRNQIQRNKIESINSTSSNSNVEAAHENIKIKTEPGLCTSESDEVNYEVENIKIKEELIEKSDIEEKNKTEIAEKNKNNLDCVKKEKINNTDSFKEVNEYFSQLIPGFGLDNVDDTELNYEMDNEVNDTENSAAKASTAEKLSTTKKVQSEVSVTKKNKIVIKEAEVDKKLKSKQSDDKQSDNKATVAGATSERVLSSGVRVGEKRKATVSTVVAVKKDSTVIAVKKDVKASIESVKDVPERKDNSSNKFSKYQNITEIVGGNIPMQDECKFSKVIIVGDLSLQEIHLMWRNNFKIKPFFLLFKEADIPKFEEVYKHECIKASTDCLIIFSVPFPKVRYGEEKHDKCHSSHSKISLPKLPTRSDGMELLLAQMEKLKKQNPNKKNCVVFSYFPIVNFRMIIHDQITEASKDHRSCICEKLEQSNYYKHFHVRLEEFQRMFNCNVLALKLNEISFGVYLEFYIFFRVNRSHKMIIDAGKYGNNFELTNLYSNIENVVYNKPSKILSNAVCSKAIKSVVVGDAWLKSLVSGWTTSSKIKPFFYYKRNITLNEIKMFLKSIKTAHHYIVCLTFPLAEFLQYQKYAGCNSLDYPVPHADMLNRDKFLTEIRVKIDTFNHEINSQLKNCKLFYLPCYPIDFEKFYLETMLQHKKHCSCSVKKIITMRNNSIMTRELKCGMNRVNQELDTMNLKNGFETLEIFRIVRESKHLTGSESDIKFLSDFEFHPEKEITPKLITLLEDSLIDATNKFSSLKNDHRLVWKNIEEKQKLSDSSKSKARRDNSREKSKKSTSVGKSGRRRSSAKRKESRTKSKSRSREKKGTSGSSLLNRPRPRTYMHGGFTRSRSKSRSRDRTKTKLGNGRRRKTSKDGKVSRSRSRSYGRRRSRSRSRDKRSRNRRSSSRKRFGRSKSRSLSKKRSSNRKSWTRSPKKSKDRSPVKDTKSDKKRFESTFQPISQNTASRASISRKGSFSENEKENGLSNLWSVHINECNNFRRNPESHPEYTKVRNLWYAEHGYAPSNEYLFQGYWVKKQECLFSEIWERKKSDYLRQFEDKRSRSKSRSSNASYNKPSKKKKKSSRSRSRSRSRSKSRSSNASYNKPSKKKKKSSRSRSSSGNSGVAMSVSSPSSISTESDDEVSRSVEKVKRRVEDFIERSAVRTTASSLIKQKKHVDTTLKNSSVDATLKNSSHGASSTFSNNLIDVAKLSTRTDPVFTLPLTDNRSSNLDDSTRSAEKIFSNIGKDLVSDAWRNVPASKSYVSDKYRVQIDENPNFPGISNNSSYVTTSDSVGSKAWDNLYSNPPPPISNKSNRTSTSGNILEGNDPGNRDTFSKVERDSFLSRPPPVVTRDRENRSSALTDDTWKKASTKPIRSNISRWDSSSDPSNVEEKLRSDAADYYHRSSKSKLPDFTDNSMLYNYDNTRNEEFSMRSNLQSSNFNASARGAVESNFATQSAASTVYQKALSDDFSVRGNKQAPNIDARSGHSNRSHDSRIPHLSDYQKNKTGDFSVRENLHGSNVKARSGSDRYDVPPPTSSSDPRNSAYLSKANNNSWKSQDISQSRPKDRYKIEDNTTSLPGSSFKPNFSRDSNLQAIKMLEEEASESRNMDLLKPKSQPTSDKKLIYQKIVQTTNLLVQISDKLGAMGISVVILHQKVQELFENNEDPMNAFDDDSKLLLTLISDKITDNLTNEKLSIVQKAVLEEVCGRLKWLLEYFKENVKKDEFWGLDLNLIAKATLNISKVEMVKFMKSALIYKKVTNIPEEDFLKLYMAVIDIQRSLVSDDLF